MSENETLQETLDQATPQQDYEQPAETAQAQPAEPESGGTRNDLNIRELREQKKQAERERDELRKRMEQMEVSQQATSKQPSLADDDLVEWKYVKQEIDGLKKQINTYQQTSTAASAEAQLKAKYQDFDKVVTQSNIERLREQYPEIAQTLSANNDLYTQASAAYDIIKRYGIYNDDSFKQEKERVHQNASKPRSMNMGSGQRGESPLDNANAFAEGLTPDLKKALQKEMNEAIKRR